VIVKGKTQPESVYAIVGRKEIEATDEFRRMHALLVELLERYRGRDWEGALQLIDRRRKSQEAPGLGPLFELYAERIEAFRANPPPEDWNGAYQLLSK
jgi:adenylate cyclase